MIALLALLSTSPAAETWDPPALPKAPAMALPTRFALTGAVAVVGGVACVKVANDARYGDLQTRGEAGTLTTQDYSSPQTTGREVAEDPWDELSAGSKGEVGYNRALRTTGWALVGAGAVNLASAGLMWTFAPRTSVQLRPGGVAVSGRF